MRLAILLTLLLGSTSYAAQPSMQVLLYDADAKKNAGSAIGKVTITESGYGLIFTPELSGLATGMHGFHIHENPSCEPGIVDGKRVAAQRAGGHWDPQKTGQHAGPYGNGHKGDLPPLQVTADGQAVLSVLAPRLRSLDEIRGHALMVHHGADNYADHPLPLGGGGARIACGVL